MSLDWHVEDADGRVEAIAPRMIDTCDECNGTGYFLDATGQDHQCKGCRGTGRMA